MSTSSIQILSVSDLYIVTTRGEIVRNSFEKWLRDDRGVEDTECLYTAFPKLTCSLIAEYLLCVRSARGNPVTKFSVRINGNG